MLAILVSLGLLGVLVAAVVDRQPSAKKAGSNAEPLVVYCAASNKSVLEAIRADYEKAFGTPLQIQYGPSQTLLAALEVAKAGDLYLPADDSYLAHGPRAEADRRRISAGRNAGRRRRGQGKSQADRRAWPTCCSRTFAWPRPAPKPPPSAS